MNATTLWNLNPSTTGRQIVMFPFLGGFGASYNRLIKEMGGDWDVWTVNPPGHGPSTEPPCQRLSMLVDRYLTELRDVLKPGAVFFGHSMGGILAYHVMLAMTGHPSFEHRRPTDLVISAARAPKWLDIAGYAALPERELLRRLLAFGAIPPEVAEDRTLIELFEPAFRADYRVLEDAQRLEPVKLDVRTELILGGRDTQTPPTALAEWQEYIVDPIRPHVLDDEGHMFVMHSVETVIPILNELENVAAWNR
ncbi:thioesterase II family protein [Haloglycomyces albus]|uniref:thioesterase II family protein n=1 Tax=Haloglycomyces albus TaxID=526067 RepID=UPI00046D7804|nr:alpha/beta fold hydrolase [Haloglycomyces albus]